MSTALNDSCRVISVTFFYQIFFVDPFLPYFSFLVRWSYVGMVEATGQQKLSSFKKSKFFLSGPPFNPQPPLSGPTTKKRTAFLWLPKVLRKDFFGAPSQKGFLSYDLQAPQPT